MRNIKSSNNVRINGADANAIGTNSTPNIAVPATDSLQEFVVQTSLYDASQGRNAGEISRFREDQFNTNFDLKLRDTHTLSFKNFFARNPTTHSNFNFAALGNGNTQLPGAGADLVFVQGLNSITDTYVFNPKVVNQARFGYTRLRNTSTPIEPFTAAELGFSSPLQNLFPGMPTLIVTGLFAFGPSPFADQSSRINSFTAGDTLSILAGAHHLRLGGEYRRAQANFFFNAFSRGQINFATFNDFLTGNGVSLIGSGVFDRSLRTNDIGAFLQDDWKFNNRLTLNLGVRYDVYGYPFDTGGRLVNLFPDQLRQGTVASPAGPPNGFVQAAGGTLAGVPEVESTLVPTDKNNISPRAGFALRLNDAGSIVARGGYGIYYDRFSTRYASTQLLNYPYFALAVGLPGILRPYSNPFIPVPQPGAFPINPTIPSPLTALSPLIGVPISGLFVDPELSTPYVQQYNANMQWELFKDYLLEVGFVGSKGTKLLQTVSLNHPVYNRAANVLVAPLGPALSTQKMMASGVQQAQTSSNSRYNSLQISMTKRFSDGLQFLAAYTLGKSQDYYSGGPLNELIPVPGDHSNWKLNYDHPISIDGIDSLRVLFTSGSAQNCAPNSSTFSTGPTLRTRTTTSLCLRPSCARPQPVPGHA